MTTPLLKFLVYALIIILTIFILGLLVVSPPSFTNSKSVYQGF